MFSKCRNRNGGGVAMYITTDYNSNIFTDFSFTEPCMECLGVEGTLADKKRLLICIYRPSSGNVESFLNRLNDIFFLQPMITIMNVFMFSVILI